MSGWGDFCRGFAAGIAGGCVFLALLLLLFIAVDVRHIRSDLARKGPRAAAASGNSCGVERAAVKHLTDGYRLGRVHRRTVAWLLAVKPPPVTQDSPRFSSWKPPEGQLEQLTDVHVIAAKQENDSDLHVIVERGDYGSELNVEAPAARCDSTSPYAARLAAARAALETALGPVSSRRYTPVDVRATVRGPLFYDVLHGQRGAPNGVELQPVTYFKAER